MSQYFPEPNEHSAAKANLKGATGIDAFLLASKTDNLDVDKLKTVPADLGKVSNVVDNDVAKRTCVISRLSKSMLLMLRCQVLLD